MAVLIGGQRTGDSTAVFLARMVMPFSRSRSLESITRSGTSLTLGKHVRLLKHGIDQGGLAVIDVSHNRHITDISTNRHRNLS